MKNITKNIVKLCVVMLGLAVSMSVHSGSSQYAATKYPIVLVGGGLINAKSLGPVDYFYRVPSKLRSYGGTVYGTSVTSMESPEFRGEQLLQQLYEIQAIDKHQKFNLVTASSGGLTARWVASVAPELVASVTSVNGAHAGSPVFDSAVGFFDGQTDQAQSLIYGALNTVTELAASLVGGVSGMDTKTFMQYHTTAGAAAFNTLYPEGQPSRYCGQGSEVADNGVYYYSFTGGHAFTNFFDPLDYALLAVHKLAMDEPSDGVFGACSSRWGKNIGGNLRLNHVDQLNHLFGIRSPWFNPLSMYLSHANRLKNKGL